jgi:hypothetical protein
VPDEVPVPIEIRMRLRLPDKPGEAASFSVRSDDLATMVSRRIAMEASRLANLAPEFRVLRGTPAWKD